MFTARPSTPETSATAKGAERRIQDRIDVEIKLTIESESNFFSGFTQNISEGGLFVATHDYKPIGHETLIRFSLPDQGEPVVVKCRVCWVREYNSMAPDMIPGMGLRFMDLGPWDAERIQDFCESLREPLFIDLDD
jgi:uncharacterized protein (TIGR02266 family)